MNYPAAGQRGIYKGIVTPQAAGNKNRPDNCDHILNLVGGFFRLKKLIMICDN